MRNALVGTVLVALLAACSSSGASATKPNPTSPTTVAKSPIDPCSLLTAAEASALAGAKVALTTDPGAEPNTCSYASPDQSVTAQVGVEVDPDDAYAQAQYPSFMQKIMNGPGFVPRPAAGIGDGATIIRSETFDAIAFRKGSVLVKIGAGPKATNAALKLTALRALGRLPAKG